MEKASTLNLQIDAHIKESAEAVLKQLGIPLPVAVDMFLYQISLTGGIPFALKLPQAPASINADTMTSDELRAKLENGFDDMQAGRVQEAKAVFQRFREGHSS